MCRPLPRERDDGSSPLARGLRHSHSRRRFGRRIIPARAGFTSSPRTSRTGSPDHPRSRGVYPGASPGGARPYGSSPLARGLRRTAAAHLVRCGIIPARAGFTRRGRGGRPATWDHPRSRGVYPGASPGGARPYGSSSLARGLRARTATIWLRIGIIPARAGFTGGTIPAGEAGWDHPRSRGVYAHRSFSPPLKIGSSPLARGLLGDVDAEQRAGRIIPARAGFTGGSRPRGALCRDHPRSRGVYTAAAGSAVSGSGSSPLARGLPRPRNLGADVRRIIPARAGFTADAYGDGGGSRDHPRSRGVYSRFAFRVFVFAGSSPLARGLHDDDDVPGSALGIIPARAGFTDISESLMACHPDHPRSRGVYSHHCQTPAHVRGSSPLARGLHGVDPGGVLERRIISARAGFTWA